MSSQTLISLDVGEKRIGVAKADTGVRIAFPLTTLEVDGSEVDSIARLVHDEQATTMVVGYPRNQQGEATAQTAFVEAFVEKLSRVTVPIVFQDESLTSVIAEQRLVAQKKPYSKADIDAYAATLILQDYLEQHHG
jgi:putative holliday junction resolvase